MKLVDRLVGACVHIGGAGRIGSTVALALEAAGVGKITCNDPQAVEEEQLSEWVFTRRSDLGRPKVHVLERFFDGRAGFLFEPLVAPNESPAVRPFLEQADLIVSCANQLPARLHLERSAVRLGKLAIQASAQDGREALGGLISVWAPQTECACFGCLFPDRQPGFGRGEVLLPTVTRTIGNLAAHLATQVLAGNPQELVSRHNLFFVDLLAYAMQSMSVKRRGSCRICRR